MNFRYDSLSRYPYKISEEKKELIKKHLSESEINYIIEWSIAPNDFIPLLEYNNFNIYNLDKYEKFQKKLYYLDQAEVINFYESVKEKNEEEVLMFLDSYYYSELLDYYNKNDGTFLIKNPNDLKAYVDDQYGISTRFYNDTTTIDFLNNPDDIKLRTILYNDFKEFCAVIDDKFDSRDCGYHSIIRGFMTYDEISNLNSDEIIPGHSEYQLGLAFDLKSYRSDDEIKKFINDNCYLYGFILRNDSSYRYIGKENALYLKKYNKTLKEVFLDENSCCK